MTQEITKSNNVEVNRIIEMWKQGEKLENDGYSDLGKTLLVNAIDIATKLDVKEREIIADALFPTN